MPTGTYTGSGPFLAYLEKRLPMVGDYLIQSLPSALLRNVPTPTEDLSRYLYQPLADFTANAGKRVRPVLCLLGAEATGGNPTQALPAAAAVEHFQSAALIHDDIADKSELRRGKPCMHISEGVGLAINTGDLALVTASETLLAAPDLDDSTKTRVLAELMRMERRTLEGQALDLGWVRDERWDLTERDYLYMVEHKTAWYSCATPLVLGALCSGSPVPAELESFGLDAGMAFQLQDDLLNLVGDADAQGKDFRSDITEGKRTLAVILARDRLDGARRDELLDLLASGTADPADLARAVELMESVGALDEVRERALSLANKAKATLDHAHVDREAATVLRSMADYFVERGA